MFEQRRNGFETNSSSTHSVFIDSRVEILDPFCPDQDGNLCLGYRSMYEFGWEEESYWGPETKINYALLQLLYVSEAYRSFQEYADRFIRVILEHTAATRVEVSLDTFYYREGVDPALTALIARSEAFSRAPQHRMNHGYIDHQSSPPDDLRILEKIYKTDDSLRSFLFSPNSFLRTGNDN